MSKRISPVSAPDQSAWLAGIRWVTAVRMQADRFEQAFREWEAALLDAELRHQLNRDDELSRSWRESQDQLEIGSRPVRVPTELLAMQLATERDFLLVAVRNVLRAQRRLAEHMRTAMTGEDELKAMRDLVEHFDDADGPAAETLRGMPHIEAQGFGYTGKEIWIGGNDGVPLSRIRAWAIRVWKALVDASIAAGIEPPTDLGRSMVEGDDDIPWPPIRLRYSWQILQVPEEEWPTQQMPDEIAELLAEKFRNLRARDPHD